MTRAQKAIEHARERLALEPNREGSDIPNGALTRDWVAVRRTQLEALVAAAARSVAASPPGADERRGGDG